MVFNEKEKSFLLSIARKTIGYYFQTGKIMRLDNIKPPSKKLLENGACFVTLHLNGGLRGCIGSLEAHRPLFADVLSNALAAAFQDSRFPPLTPKELEHTTISMSVLTKPKPLVVRDANDLLEKLVAGTHGLILSKSGTRATFLPVVWEELPEKQDFLSHLCLKAGLRADEWKKTAGMEFWVYEAEEFSE